jgi:hypothetical protein
MREQAEDDLDDYKAEIEHDPNAKGAHGAPVPVPMVIVMMVVSVMSMPVPLGPRLALTELGVERAHVAGAICERGACRQPLRP